MDRQLEAVSDRGCAAGGGHRPGGVEDLIFTRELDIAAVESDGVRKPLRSSPDAGWVEQEGQGRRAIGLPMCLFPSPKS